MRTLKNKSLVRAALVGAAILLALTGCTTAPESTPAPPAETEEVSAPQCSGLSGIEALEKWANEVESDLPWDVAGVNSVVDGYDECAEISWIVLRPESCCTAFEVTPVMFFNRGEYVSDATVTDRAIDRGTEPERISDGEIALTFTTQVGANVPPKLTRTTYTWDEASESVQAADQEPAVTEASGHDVDGYWCPTPESQDTHGCVTIAFPNATYDSGDTRELVEVGVQDGATTYSVPGAPFGVFFPAGVSIQIPDYYAGADSPAVDRIWNGQTGVLLLRQ